MSFTLTKTNQALHYQVDGVNGTKTVLPYDSGTILGTVPPGKPGLKLTDGTQQSFVTTAADATPGVDGNFVGHSQDGLSEDGLYGPTNGEKLGYSLLGE